MAAVRNAFESSLGRGEGERSRDGRPGTQAALEALKVWPSTLSVVEMSSGVTLPK